MMSNRKKYRKKPDQFIIAVQLDLETDGFAYSKWGAMQKCKRGDWLVNNNGETYTIDAEAFTRTYRNISPGQYVKSTGVWAEEASRDGSIPTKEGITHYTAGDYLVSNNENGGDSYAVSRAKFEEMYEPVE